MAVPPILLIHGAALNRRMWDPALPILGAEFTVLTIDLPGHGRAGDRPFRLDQAVAEVVELLRTQAPDGAVLAGDSLGGYVSMAVAGVAPDRVRGLVASGCTHEFRGLAAVSARVGSWLGQALVSAFGSTRLLARVQTRVRQVYPQAPLDSILEGGLRLEGRAEALAELAGRDLLTPLERYQGPILAINGELDRPNRRGEAGFLRRFPRARLEVVPRSPHGVSLWDPALFARLVGSFVREIR